MLHLKLGDRREINQHSDPLKRPWVGYDPNQPDDVLFEQNRGIWHLGQRAERETHVLFSFTGDNTVKFVAEIDRIEQAGDKRAVVGRPLPADHPIAKKWVGAPAPDNFRNPVTYSPSPGDDGSTCACGCGTAVPSSRMFAPGHDQRAIHARIEKEWGNTLRFIQWFDAEYGAP
jgi:hypothetical protein